MESISTYSEARNEYLKQLSTWIVPYMITHFRGIWADAQKVGGNKREMISFQEKCAEVPKWNQDIIDENVGKLLDSCRCDYLEELMAAVFIAHTKVLISIRVSSKHKKLQITLPKLDHFLHRVFSECARSFWKSPFLFLDDQKPIEMQKNLLQAEVLCSESIASAVRSLLPIKNILNEYLSDDVMAAEPVIEDSDEPKTGGSEESKLEEVAAPAFAPPAPAPAFAAPTPTPAPAFAAPAPAPEAQVPELIVSEEQVPELIISEEKPVEQVPELIVSEEKPVAEPELNIQELHQPEQQDHVESQEQEQDKEEIVIDTEPAVHFSDYDNVFEEQTGSFTYNPKTDDDNHMTILGEDSTSLDLDSSVTKLESSGSNSMMADEILE